MSLTSATVRTIAIAFALLVTATGEAQWMHPRILEPHTVPLADAGEGGALIVTGRPELCAGEGTELIVRRNLPQESTVQSVGRVPVVRPCYWEFHDLLPGLYDALIQTQRDEQIRATGEVELARGSTMVITLEPLDLEVQGRVTIGGAPSQDLRVLFASTSLPALDWYVVTDREGNYRTQIRSGDSLCIRVERLQPFNSWSQCDRFLPGLRQLDLEIPPGVIRIEVSAPIGTWPDQVHLEVAGGTKASGRTIPSTSYHGEFFGSGYGSYLIRLTRSDDGTVLASTELTLSPDQPTAVVRFTPPAR